MARRRASRLHAPTWCALCLHIPGSDQGRQVLRWIRSICRDLSALALVAFVFVSPNGFMSAVCDTGWLAAGLCLTTSCCDSGWAGEHHCKKPEALMQQYCLPSPSL